MKARVCMKRVTALFVAVSLIFAGAAAWSGSSAAFAADQESITVYVTMSERGEIASAQGRLMADVPVQVPVDEGMATVDAVMDEFHQQYKPGGYTCDSYVTQLWGIETSNTLFFINDLSLISGVEYEPVKDGDRITASVNADDKFYSDYYTYFTERSVKAGSGDTVDLELKGYMGMTQNAASEPIANAEIGIVTEDGFQKLEGVVTDEEGKAAVRLDKAQFTPGKTYVLSAKGTVKTTATDWSAEGTPTVEVDAPLIAPVCQVKVESGIVTGVKNTRITSVKATAAKGSVRLTWKKSAGYKVDKYQVFRSTKKGSGYGSKAFFTTKQGGLTGWYKNTKALKKGTRYYYKVRGVRTVDGEKVYTRYSAPVSVRAK